MLHQAIQQFIILHKSHLSNYYSYILELYIIKYYFSSILKHLMRFRISLLYCIISKFLKMNQNQILTPELVHKASIQFKKEDVLSSMHEKSERLKRLISAMKLGNNHKQKVRIHFMNINNQMLEIKAKVWSVTEKYVILRNSISIPITSIREVNYH